MRRRSGTWLSPGLLRRQRLLAPLAVHQFLDEFDALEVEQLRVLLDAAVERHADLPRPRESLRILDRRFVGNDVRAGAREPLDDVQLIAVEIAGAIEPGLIVEALGIDDEALAFPLADRLSHPRIDRWRPWILQIDVTDGARVLVSDEEGALALEDLERLRHVHRARHSGQVALDFGIALQPL